MKRFLIIAIILLMGIPGSAKQKTDVTLHIGTPQSDVAKIVGKPDIITQDSDNILTWIYTDLKKLPVPKVTTSERTEKVNESTILTIKFDSNYKIINYAYMTTYIGEEHD
jgi:hypothetical protein